MIDNAVIKVLDFRDDPKNRKYLLLIKILSVLFFLFVIIRIVKAKNSRKPIGKDEGKLTDAAPESMSATEEIEEIKIKSIADFTKKDKEELLSEYRNFMISNLPNFTDTHLITLEKASVFPLANLDGTLYRAEFRNPSNGKSLIVSLDIHGIYNEKRKGNPYYHIQDEERGAKYEVDYDKDKIESFISESLGLEEPVEEAKEETGIGEEEESIGDKLFDRSPLDDHFLKMNRDRKPDADSDMTKIKGISDKRSAELNKAGIFYVEDLQYLPDDCIPILEKILDGIWAKQIMKWRTNARDLKIGPE